MNLDAAQTDRAAGTLLGLACGDALGVPYEFATPPGPGELAAMSGGGLGDFAPGEWSDDTSMAVAIAEVAATGANLTDEEALDAIAENFLRWFDDGPPDIGNQTRAVLSATRRRLANGETGPAGVMRQEAQTYALVNPHSAGNGALMRTAPVALASLDCRDRTAEAASEIARLTHADPLAIDSCVLWSEAIRVAVLEGRIDVAAGLDLISPERRDLWRGWLAEAAARPPAVFTPNGYTVTALQAAVAAICQTPTPREDFQRHGFPCLHLQDALHAAVRIGDDTDTVSAIAGGLLGARWGASAVPWRWRRAVHGWPGRDGRDLIAMATLAVQSGVDDPDGWPSNPNLNYSLEGLVTNPIPHPHDPAVLLGNYMSRDHQATAVVSLCRVGRQQACFSNARIIIESRLIDSDHPEHNPNLHFAVHDAADAVRGLRAEGHTVLLHCVAARQRTPSIAVAYSALLGNDPTATYDALINRLPHFRGYGAVLDAAADLYIPASSQPTEVPDYIADRIRQSTPAGCSVVPGSTPVISFGNPTSAWVATLGLNPSLREFADSNGKELTEGKRRLATTASLGILDLTDASTAHVAQVTADCYSYFQRNPYHWFKDLENLMAAAVGSSFYDGTACHLDLVQWATEPVWQQLSVLVQRQLISEDREFLRRQLQQEKIRLVLLNGRGVIDQVKAMGITLRTLVPAVMADRSCDIVAGSDGETFFIGWSTNLQSSFGISNAFKATIAQRVAEEVKKSGLGPNGTNTPPTAYLAQGAVAHSKTELVEVLAEWLTQSRATTIGDIGRFSGRAWAAAKLGEYTVILNADTKRDAVASYVAHAREFGAEGPWHVVANKNGTINKVAYAVDSATPGWYCYTSVPLSSPEEI